MSTWGDREGGILEITADNRRTRNDIEGLRAVAVLSVLAHHAFSRALPGGFAGVDVFFVISGYLIGRHLLQDIQNRRLSIFGFYAKRARRIFPALALVLLFVWCAGWVVYSAPEFAALGKHIAAAAAFSNNILLWSESGYFDAAAIDKPLLHLWSLGIEEQFYLLVPALLWMSAKGAVGSVRWVARLGALSLLTTVIVSNFDYAASFYLLHTRFWELAAGVVLAQVELRMTDRAQHESGRSAASKWDNREIRLFSIAFVFASVIVFGAVDVQSMRDSILRDCGLALIVVAAVAAVFLADRSARPHAWNSLAAWLVLHEARVASACAIVGTLLIAVTLIVLDSADWPGAQTFITVAGTVLLIAAKPAALCNRLLAWKPLAFIGGMSYPLYLWHWPIIVISRLLRPDASGIGLLLPLAASFVLAWLTKTFLEDPVRFGRLGSQIFRRPPLWPSVSALAVAGLLGLWVLLAAGLSWRFPPVLRAIADWREFDPNTSWRAGHCYHYLNDASEFSSECTPAKRPGIPLLLLWGDSHAAHLYPGIAHLQSSMGFDLAQWTAAGCPPTVKPLAVENEACVATRAAALLRLAQLKPDTVVLGAAWARYLESGRSSDGIVRTLAETVRYLKILGIGRIVVFGPGPTWTTSLPVDLFRSMVGRRSNEIPERLGKVTEEVLRLDLAMGARARAEGIEYVSVLSYFCNQAGCMTLGNKALPSPDLLYGDKDHLTETGSKALIEHSRFQLFGRN